MINSSFIEKTYVVEHIGIASIRQFQCVPTIYDAEKKKTILNLHL